MNLCSTPEALHAALQALSGQSHIILDCEGQTLGEVGGKLSLMNLGVIRATQGQMQLTTFLIDTLAFQGSKSHYLGPVFELLKSGSVYKIMFDGRMDASELLHGHGVQLSNVLDLQIADILSRGKRRESVERQLQRLVGFLPQQEITTNRSLYVQVQKLNGLDSAINEYGINGGPKGYVDHSKWLRRPLDQGSLSYAAADIRKICLLYQHFVAKGYISETTLATQSASYLALHARARPHGSDKYKRHGLFPLAVLSETPSVSAIRCRGCDRDLPTVAFTPPASRAREVKCFVCRAVDVKAGTGNRGSFRPRQTNYEDFCEEMFDEIDAFDDENVWDEDKFVEYDVYDDIW